MRQHITCWRLSILLNLEEPFALQKLGNGIFYQHFFTLSYSDNVLIENFDLIIFYFYFVFEIFGNDSVSIP